MAEEEVLEETAAPPKKSSGGGFSVVHLIVIVVVVIVAAVAVIMATGGKIAGMETKLGEQVEVIKSVIESNNPDPYNLPDFNCPEDGAIVPLSDKALIVSLSDGQHYLSLGISVCLKPGVDEEKFAPRKALLLHLVNDYFSKFSKEDFFGGSQVAPSGDGENLLEEFERDVAGAPFVNKRDESRKGLLQEINRRFSVENKIVEDILITEFLIQ